MPRQLELEIGNLLCKFGEKLVLNDLLTPVVVPAFFADTTRSYRDTSYFFTRQKFSYLKPGDIDTLALTCRFVKNTVLRRHQIFDSNKGIVQSEDSMESAPSSIAILLLSTHRLLYVREVPNAPSMNQFASTFKFLLRNSVMNYHNSLYSQAEAGLKPISMRAIKAQIPIPEVSVIPLVSRESLKTFVDRFEILKNLKVQLAPTNNELDNEDFFKNLRKRKEEVGSTTTVVVHRNNAGLNKQGCLEHVEAAKQGNAFVEMRGVDAQGDELVGTNSEFSVKALLPKETKAMSKNIEQAIDKYFELLGSEVITVGKAADNKKQQLAEIHNEHMKGQNDE